MPSKLALASNDSGDDRAGRRDRSKSDQPNGLSAPAASGSRDWLAVLAWGGLALALLTFQFSPNWLEFWNGLRGVKADVSPAESVAIDRAILSGYSARGFYVTQQAIDLSATIDDANHQIVRWRLLFPLVGYLLHLPGWAVLGLAHLGCAILIFAWVAVARRLEAPVSSRAYEAGCYAVIAGASAPFFTSMGLPGYYDSWLALALLAVSVVPARGVVVLVAVLAPWIDERFVIGLPLALGVRYLLADPAPASLWSWLRRQAFVPLAAVIAFSLLRLTLGGAGGSQTVREYLDTFIFSESITWLERLRGAWEGLRFGWVLVAVAIVATWRRSPSRRPWEATALIVAIVVTALVGLYTALDLGRSMVLLIPVLPLGWILAQRQAWWRRFHFAPILAVAALLVPASHVVGKFARPVDKVWAPPFPLVIAQTSLGALFAAGEGVGVDVHRAMSWYRKAAQHGHGVAQYNVGVMYASGPYKDTAEALKWYRLAAAQGVASAHFNLGVMSARGTDVPRDLVQAHRLLAAAATLGHPNAKASLAQLETFMQPAEIQAARMAGPALLQKPTPR